MNSSQWSKGRERAFDTDERAGIGMADVDRRQRIANWVRRYLPARQGRYLALLLIDSGFAVLAVAAALVLRMNGAVPDHMWRGFLFSVPVIALLSVPVFHASGLYSRAWRYLSARDILPILLAATVSTGLWVVALLALGHTGWLPASVPIIGWFILSAGLCGVRLSRRLALEYLRQHQEPKAIAGSTARLRRALVAGTDDHVELALRMLEGNPAAGYQPIGILDDQVGHLGLRVRGTPVLGGLDQLEQAVTRLAAMDQRPDIVFLADDHKGMGGLEGPRLVRFVTEAERLGLSVARLPVAWTEGTGAREKLDLDFVDLASLLGRTPRVADTGAIASFVAGQRVMVTGAGGTIGRELVFQLAKAGPAEIVLVDAAEYNLYLIDQELGEAYPDLPRTPVLCSIRQRGNVMNMFAKFRPNLVFHAAALKHVPLVETNPCAGALTNVIGTRNVADAAKRYGARAMVQVSTDKAVNPVGLMGATKRLGELYCQALDLEGQSVPVATRFLTVRFGNVIGSSGSLIPLLQRQLARGGPLTVTHPEIQRYFMTVNEAVLLILQGAAMAMRSNRHHGRIFVLDMGEPIRIIDIARRMIRLAGLEPDRDIRIDLIGLRPGEKLYEELFDSSEKRLESSLPGIYEAEPVARPLKDLNAAFNFLEAASLADDCVTARTILPQIVDGSFRANVDPLRDMMVPVADEHQPALGVAA